MKQLCLILSFIFGMASLASSQTPAKTTKTTSKSATKTNLLVGKWQGNYQGSAAGKCALEFSQGNDGKPTGQITIQPDGGESSPLITFDSINLNGTNFTASFTDPEGDKVEMVGKVENNHLKGTWKTSGNESGTWQTDKTK